MSLFVEIGRVPEGLVELWWCASASHEYIGHSIQFEFPQFQSYDKAALETARRELKQIGGKWKTSLLTWIDASKTSTSPLVETSPEKTKQALFHFFRRE